MKKLSLLIGILLCLQACEKVVEVNLPTENPKLVIAATGIQNGQDSSGKLTVKLSQTAPYFQDSVPKVSHAEVRLRVAGETYSLPEVHGSPGTYRTTVPMIYDKAYELTIKTEGQTYRGETELYKTVDIDVITQSEGVFDSDQTQIKVFYTDPVEEENYYLFSFNSKHGKELTPSDDEFYNGNRVSTLYSEDFKTGDTIAVSINGTGQSFNRYISILIRQSGQAGNPFATSPATVRGNMVNVNAPDKFPLGYFRMSQQFKTTYTIH